MTLAEYVAASYIDTLDNQIRIRLALENREWLRKAIWNFFAASCPTDEHAAKVKLKALVQE